MKNAKTTATALTEKLIGGPLDASGPDVQCRGLRKELLRFAKNSREALEATRVGSLFVLNNMFKTKFAEDLLGAKYANFYNSYKAAERSLAKIDNSVSALDHIHDRGVYHVKCLELGVEYDEWLKYFTQVPVTLLGEIQDITNENLAALEAAFNDAQSAKEAQA